MQTGTSQLVWLISLCLTLSMIFAPLDSFGQSSKNETKSLFETIYELDGQPKVIINSDFRYLFRNVHEEVYQEASIQVFNGNEETIIELDGRTRSRGNMRKQVCRFPPLKFDFNKKELKSKGFLGADKLKFVFPCGLRGFEQEKLYKEHLVYEIYDEIDTIGMRTKLIDVRLEGSGDPLEFVGMLIEDEDEYARRFDAKIVVEGKLKGPSLDRIPFLKVQFFQYLIANTDWAVSNKHNLEMVKFPDRIRVAAVPYDFDYSGLVGQHYAVPHEDLPIVSVRDRYFVPYPVNEEEFYQMVDFYLGIEQNIYDVIDGADYMSSKSRAEVHKFVSKYYDKLKKPKRFIGEVVQGG